MRTLLAGPSLSRSEHTYCTDDPHGTVPADLALTSNTGLIRHK